MLEDARKKGASIFVYLIFSLLILIFVINFGPQGGQGGGCSDSSNVVISVDGKEASQTAYQVSYQANSRSGKEKTYTALELIIRQELLAQEAEARGLRVTTDMVMDEIKKGYFFLGGQRYQIPRIFTEDGFWNQNAFKSWVQGELSLRSRGSYVDEQERGLLASLMRSLLEESVQVSRDEALQHYLFEHDTVQYDVVAFRPDAYRAAMKLTDADVERFLATHGPEVEARYKADERTYKGVKPQLQLRQIFIAAPAPEAAAPAAPDQGSAAGSTAGSAADNAAPAGSGAGSAVVAAKPATPADAAKPADTAAKSAAGAKADETKAKLEAVRKAAEKDKQKFIAAAKTLSSDEAMKNSAGDLGWRTAESPMLGEKAVSDAVKDLKAGEMTPVITTDRGSYLILAEARREGDLSYDQVKHEIAKELARDVWSKEAAKRAALSALDKAKSSTLPLDQMYDKEQMPANQGIDIQQIMNDPNISPEQKQQILEMLMKSQGGKQGSIVWESEDVPASWKAQADGAGGGSATPAAPAKPAAPATGSAAPAKPAAPATGSAAPAKPADSAAPTKPASATGSAATPAADAKASGSAAAPATGTPATTGAPAPAPATPDITPSTDKLPEFGEIKKPTVARFGPAPREPSMGGIGANKAAQVALFEELSPGAVANKVYEADGNYVVLQLVSRSQPKVADFEKDADRLVHELRAERGQLFVEDWMKHRCETLLAEGKIRPNPGLLRDTDDKGNVVPTQYRPCMSFR